MDSLFIIQRYWGSDEENEEGDNHSNRTFSDDNYCVPNKKVKIDIPVIEIDNEDNFCSKDQSLNHNVNKQKNEKIDASIIELDDSNYSDKSNEKYANEIDSEIEVLGNVKSKDSLPNAENDSHLSKTFHIPKSNISKKKKKYKLVEGDLEVNRKEELPLENIPQKIEDTEIFCPIGEVQYPKDTKIIHALPNWLCNPTYISINLLQEETPISELNYLDSNTKKNLKNAGIDFLFPVQLAVIPWLIQNKEQSLLIRPSDICVSAPTGSGKTLAFVLPIVQSLKDRVVCAIRALVVLPVTELAIQVYKVFDKFIQGTDLKIALLTGQKSFIAEQNVLIKSSGEKHRNLVDIVITTPGRLHDHIYRTKGFCLRCLRYLVIDEADRMMEEIQEGLLKEVEDAVFRDCIISNCVCSFFKRTSFESSSAFNFGFISQPLQKLLYSATLTHDPEQLHSLSLYKPKLFTTSSINSEQEYSGTSIIPSELTILQVVSEENVKPLIICHLIKQHGFKKVLCFTETVERAHRLHLVLENMGLLQVREISSFNRAIQRKIVLEQFSCGRIDILVCSDLVARGIDIEDIDCVISYDVPQIIKTYIHRIGRTARAGKTGTAITLLSEREIPNFKKMIKSVGIKLPEKIIISPEDLKPLIVLYKTALAAADAKLKEEKNHVSGRLVKIKGRNK